MEFLSYAYIFFQSNLLEIPMYLLFYCSLQNPKHSFKNVASGVTLVNLLTHTIVFFLIMPLKLSFLTNILLAEAFAILAEMFLHRWYFGLSFRRTFSASAMANLVSWQIAPIVTYLVFY